MNNEIKNSQLPSVAALSYLGDARYDLYVRRLLVDSGLSKSGALNRKALEYVTCEAQAASYKRIEHLLTEEEHNVFKRAFNSTHLNKPKRASGLDYRLATGFEALIGMLHWTGNEERLEFLLEKSHSIEENQNDTEN